MEYMLLKFGTFRKPICTYYYKHYRDSYIKQYCLTEIIFDVLSISYTTSTFWERNRCKVIKIANIVVQNAIIPK